MFVLTVADVCNEKLSQQLRTVQASRIFFLRTKRSEHENRRLNTRKRIRWEDLSVRFLGKAVLP